MKGVALLGSLAVNVACSARLTLPATLDTAHDQCVYCRMIVSDQRYASQLVAPYQEPQFFDDTGCLTAYLADPRHVPEGAVAYVADHRTRAWVRADQAIYTRVNARTAPMGSHLIAHASPASRDADPEAFGGTPADPRLILPHAKQTGGSR